MKLLISTIAVNSSGCKKNKVQQTHNINKLFVTDNGQKFNSVLFGKLLPLWNLSYNIGFKHTWCHNMFLFSLWEEQNSFNKFIWKLYNFGVKRECISMNEKIKHKYGTLPMRLEINVKHPTRHIPDYGTLCPYWGYWWVLQEGCPAESTCAQLRRVDPDVLAHNYQADTDTSMTTCGHSCSVLLETCHSLSSLRLLSVKSKCCQTKRQTFLHLQNEFW